MCDTCGVFQENINEHIEKRFRKMKTYSKHFNRLSAAAHLNNLPPFVVALFQLAWME
jgi:hypothetical protein